MSTAGPKALKGPLQEEGAETPSNPPLKVPWRARPTTRVMGCCCAWGTGIRPLTQLRKGQRKRAVGLGAGDPGQAEGGLPEAGNAQDDFFRVLPQAGPPGARKGRPEPPSPDLELQRTG